jgi:hypothetical protein
LPKPNKGYPQFYYPAADTGTYLFIHWKAGRALSKLVPFSSVLRLSFSRTKPEIQGDLRPPKIGEGIETGLEEQSHAVF